MENSINSDTNDYGKETLGCISLAVNLNKWIVELIQNHFGDEILEIGSGIGNISKLLPVRNFLTLTDIYPYYINLLQDIFSDKPSVNVQKLDIGQKPACEIINKKYDTVICLNVLEHVKDDNIAVQNMKAFLKQNGKMILLVPQYQWLYGTFDSELGHYRRYTQRGLRQLLESNGMVTVKSFNFNSLGIIGWWFNAVFFKKKHMSKFQVTIYDKIVPLLRIYEKFFSHPGLSIINISQKNNYDN